MSGGVSQLNPHIQIFFNKRPSNEYYVLFGFNQVSSICEKLSFHFPTGSKVN
jgi:hypothetical protein